MDLSPVSENPRPDGWPGNQQSEHEGDEATTVSISKYWRSYRGARITEMPQWRRMTHLSMAVRLSDDEAASSDDDQQVRDGVQRDDETTDAAWHLPGVSAGPTISHGAGAVWMNVF